MIPTPEEQATQDTLDLTQGFAIQRQPDRASETLRYAKEQGIPFEQAEAATKDGPASPGPSWGGLVRTAPVLAHTLTDPAFAAASHDDVDNLHGWEKLFGGWRDMAWATAQEWKRGSLNVEVGGLGRQMLNAAQGRGTWTPENQARLDTLNKEIESIPQAKLGFFTGVPAMAAQSLPIMIRGMKNAGRETSVGAGAGLVAGALAGAPAGGVGAIPGAAAGLITGAGMGFTAGTAKGAGEDEAGLAMVEYSQTPGVDLKTAAAAATVVGVVNGTLEILPLEKVLKVVPGAKTWMSKGPVRDFMRKVIKSETGKAALARFAGRLTEGALLEGMTEFAQEVTTIVAGQVASVAPPTTFEKALDRAWEAGKGGAQGGLGFGLWHTTGELRADLAAAEAAKQRKGFYEALGGLAADSKVMKRIPEEHKAYLDKLIEKYGAADTISVPTEKLNALFQKEGWTEEDVRTKLPGVASQIAEGSPEIAILTPDFAQHIAPTAGYTALHQDLRVGDEPTLREAADIEKRAQEVLKDFEKLKPDENPVFADLYTKLQAAGLSEQVVNRYATLWTAFIENRAKRQGIDPKEYYAGLNLSISNADLVEAIIPEETVQTLSPQMLALREKALRGDKVAMDALEAEFSKDELTGARGQNAWKRFMSQNPAGVFLAIDVNDLKRVNDTLGGHGQGDVFLKAISDAVMPAVQKSKGKFFRSGGDEFSAHFMSREHADAAVSAITEAMNALPALFEGKHKASISMGLGMSPEQADLASMKAKEGARAAGRSGWRPGVVSQVDLSKGDVFFHPDESPAQALAQKVEITEKPAFKKWRGKIEFDDTRKWFKMTLTGKANLSTFLHESGHAFLEILRRDALAGDAQSAADLSIVEKWMAEGTPDRIAQLEKFARGFEAYLYEGTAPSSELAGVFAAFKTWLRFIYAAFKTLQVDLTDEVRGVMDRLVASDDEIQKARERTGLFTALGPTELAPGDLATFKDRYERAVQAKQTEMEHDSLSELRRALQDAKTQIRDEVEATARKDKAWNAAEFLRTGKTLDPDIVLAPEVGKKLSRATINEYIEEGDKRKIKLEKMISEDGMDADALAPYLGYGSGQELVTALLDAPSRAGWIKEQVDARMAEKYPNSTVASLSEQAMMKLHDGTIDAVLEAELDAFERKTGATPAPRARDVIRLAARKRVEGMTLQEMQPGKELRAEERASRDVLAAVAKKDYETARDARRRQMWHRFMYRETTQAKAEVAKIRDYLHTFEELPTRKRIGKAGERYVEAIDAILEAVDLSKRTDTALARRASLEKYLQEMEADGEPVAIPPELRAELGIKNWRQMTLDEMRGINAAVANIAALAKLKNKLFDGRQRRDFVVTTTKLASHIRANVGINFDANLGQKSWVEKRKEFFRKARANMSKIEFVCRVLDGGKTAGWAHELIFQPLADAQDRKFKMTHAITEELMRPLKDMSFKDRLRFDKNVDFLGQKLKFREVIALILNLGNEGNKEKLIKGFSPWGFTEQNVMDKLNEMHAKGEILDSDLDLVQHIWKTIDKLWPEIRALSQRNVGLAPPKVEATPLKIGSRTLEGGYYPVVYNRDLSHKGEQIAQRKTGDLFENNFLLPSVEKGFTESRTKFFAPILLSLDVIPDHINEVIHYVTHYEAVRAVDRITSSKVVEEALTEGLGKEMYQLFRPWLQAIAADGAVHESTKWYDALLRRLRLGSSIALLGFKMTTGLKQIFGLTTSAKEIGGRYIMTGTRIFLGNVLTGKGWGEVSELSTEFKETERTLDRDIGAMFRSLEGAFSLYGEAKSAMAHFALAWLMLNQRAVNAITWYGAREKAMTEDHPDPVAYANSVMRMSQAGGGLKDLAAVQRGSEMERTLTVMYTYFSVLFNQVTEPMPQKSGGQKVAILAARWWWLITLPALLEVGASTGAPKDDKDKEKYLEALTYGQLLYFGRSIPLAGDVAESFFKDREARYGAWIGTMIRAAKSAKDIQVGKGNKADVKNLVDLLGAATGLPAGAAKNSYEFANKFLSGSMEEPVQNFLFRNPSEFK